MIKDACCYCDSTEKELRPYGPKGSWVCFPCAMSTVERMSEAKYNLHMQIQSAIEASPSGRIVIGEVTGPRPYLNDSDDEF